MTAIATSLNTLVGGGSASLRDRQSALPSLESFTRKFEGATRQGERETLREAAGQLVSTSFIMPVLSILREGAMTEGPFAPGMAERRFGPLFDQHIADKITQAANFPLIDAIVDRYLPRPVVSAPEGDANMKEPLDARA